VGDLWGLQNDNVLWWYCITCGDCLQSGGLGGSCALPGATGVCVGSMYSQIVVDCCLHFLVFLCFHLVGYSHGLLVRNICMSEEFCSC
jgi:hypothetical protein